MIEENKNHGEIRANHWFGLTDGKWSLLPSIILSIGLIIRVIGYTESAIRYDEAISLFRASTPFVQFLKDLHVYSSQFLWEMILRVVIIFGTDLRIIRLPAILAALFSVILLLKIMDNLKFSVRQKIFVSITVAFCPGLLWISQDARAYRLLILLYLLAIYFSLNRKWLGFFAVNGLFFYTHMIGPSFAIGAFIFAFITYPSEWKRLFLLGLGVIVSWMPWVILSLHLEPTPNFINTFWLGKLSLENFYDQLAKSWFTRDIGNTQELFFVVTFLLTLLISMVSAIKERSRNIVIFLAPFSVVLVVSVLWTNTMFYRTLITLIIPFAISLGSVIKFERYKLLDGFVAVLWMVLAIIGAMGWNPRSRGGDVDVAARYVQTNWQPGDILYYGTGTAAMPFDYYLAGKPEYMLDGITNSNLTPPTLMHKFQFLPLENIPGKRAWVIFPRDPILPSVQVNRLEQYVKTGTLIQSIRVFEVPDIQVYLVDLPLIQENR